MLGEEIGENTHLAVTAITGYGCGTRHDCNEIVMMEGSERVKSSPQLTKRSRL
jgi:hypothetical protein